MQLAVLFINPHPRSGKQKAELQTLELVGQIIGEPIHCPLIQISPLVHKLLSEQLPPFKFEETQPLVGLQISAVQGLLSLQTKVEPPVQTSLEQVSLVVQAFKSSQGVPSTFPIQSKKKNN